MTQRVLKALDEDDRARLEQVLAHEPDTAGGLMNTDTVTVRPDVSLDVVQRYLRLRGELPPHTDALYVVDRYGAYLGALTLDKILTRSADDLVANAMARETAAIPTDEDSHDVAPPLRVRRLDLGRRWSAHEGHPPSAASRSTTSSTSSRGGEHNMMSMAGLARGRTSSRPRAAPHPPRGVARHQPAHGASPRPGSSASSRANDRARGRAGGADAGRCEHWAASAAAETLALMVRLIWRWAGIRFR